MDYDAVGQMLRQRFYDSSGVGLATNGFGYEPGGQIALSTNALGGITTNLYTARGQIKFQRSPDGSTNGWTYYADGRPRREIQRNGAYWETTYDDANRKKTRIFYSSTGSPLATNSVVTDRRGNPVQKIDEAFSVFTNRFDGLDRLKVAAGPPVVTVSLSFDFSTWITNVVQQITTYLHDNSGKSLTVSNAVGEKTVTISDPIGRPVSVQVYPTNSGTAVRLTTNVYSPDHHSLTVTNGSGSAAITSTMFTDNDGRTLLSIAYPSSSVREFSRSKYDFSGNLIYEERDSSTNGSVTTWSSASYTYDGLNRMVTKSDRDSAVTSSYYDVTGNVTNRIMPGGNLKWQATYNSAGQMLSDWNLGTGNAGTRTNNYSYFGASSPFAGLLLGRTNGLGVACAYVYDDFLRLATNVHSQVVGLATNKLTTDRKSVV